MSSLFQTVDEVIDNASLMEESISKEERFLRLKAAVENKRKEKQLTEAKAEKANLVESDEGE